MNDPIAEIGLFLLAIALAFAVLAGVNGVYQEPIPINDIAR